MNSPRPKVSWELTRRRYTWHLRASFRDKFDGSHWWKVRPNSDPLAALYELARRHPLVAEQQLIVAPPPWGRPPVPLPPICEPHPSLQWTRWLRLKSWPKLTNSERGKWKSSLGKLKGFDLRAKESLCRNITRLAHLAIYSQRGEANKAFVKSSPILKGLAWFQFFTDPTDREWDEAIAQHAAEARRKGYILLGVAPDLPAGKAGAILAAEYRKHLRTYPPLQTRGRARWEDWLPLIAAFEDAERSQHKGRNQIFARYRRAVDGIRFA